MRRNCGVLAYDKLVGELNGRGNTISLNTLAKLAQDNEFLLYPMAVPIDRVDEIEFPAIVYTDNHFVYWDTLQHDDKVYTRDVMYVLSHIPVEGCLLSEKAAKKIKGQGGMGTFTGGGGSMGAYNPPYGSQVARIASTPSISSYIVPSGSNINYTSSYVPSPSMVSSMSSPIGSAGYNAGVNIGKAVSSMFANPAGTTAGTPSIGTSAVSAFNPAWEQGPAFSPAWTNKAMTNTLNYLTTGPNQVQNAAWGKPISTVAASTMGLKALESPDVMGAAIAKAKAEGMAPKWAPDALVKGPLTQKLVDVQNWGKANLPGAAVVPQVAQQVAPNKLMQTLQEVGNQALPGLAGTATQAIMNKILASPTPNFTELPEVQALRDAIGQAKTKVGALSQEELSRILSTPVGSLIPEENAYYQQAKERLNEAYKEKKEALARAYQSYGRINSSEHIKEQQALDDELADKKQELIAQLAHEKLSLELDYKKAALAAALGIEEQAAAELMGLANLSVQEAALKYGLEAQQVQDIRNAVSGTVTGAVSAALNPNVSAPQTNQGVPGTATQI